MGNILEKQFKNYHMNFIPSSSFPSIQKSQRLTQFYKKDLMPQQFRVDSIGLLSGIKLDELTLKQSTFKNIQSITVLTYNVWFQEHNTYSRYPALLKMLYESNADIICLQQVSDKFLKALKQSAKLITTDYFMPVMKMQWYDTLILSKYPCKFYKKPFTNSQMDRCNLAAIIQFQQQNKNEMFKLVINCVHLESQNAQIRIQQLKQIDSLNKDVDMSIIAGDFNFTDGSIENQAIENYIDVWKTGKKQYDKTQKEQTKEIGITFPPNPHNKLPLRLDHIILKSKQKQIVQNEIVIIGNFTIPPYQKDNYSKVGQDFIVRTPSDHFGLLSKIYIT